MYVRIYYIMPEPKQEHRHDRGMSMGGMSR